MKAAHAFALLLIATTTATAHDRRRPVIVAPAIVVPLTNPGPKIINLDPDTKRVLNCVTSRRDEQGRTRSEPCSE